MFYVLDNCIIIQEILVITKIAILTFFFFYYKERKELIIYITRFSTIVGNRDL